MAESESVPYVASVTIPVRWKGGNERFFIVAIKRMPNGRYAARGEDLLGQPLGSWQWHFYGSIDEAAAYEVERVLTENIGVHEEMV